MKKNLFLKMFVVTMNFFTCNALKCVSMNNQEFKIRPKMININCNEPYSVKLNECSGTCNSGSCNINDSYAKLCVPDVIKNINVKVFNLMSRSDKKGNTEWHQTCKCKCRRDASICNNKRR